MNRHYPMTVRERIIDFWFEVEIQPTFDRLKRDIAERLAKQNPVSALGRNADQIANRIAPNVS